MSTAVATQGLTGIVPDPPSPPPPPPPRVALRVANGHELAEALDHVHTGCRRHGDHHTGRRRICDRFGRRRVQQPHDSERGKPIPTSAPVSRPLRRGPRWTPGAMRTTFSQRSHTHRCGLLALPAQHFAQRAHRSPFWSHWEVARRPYASPTCACLGGCGLKTASSASSIAGSKRTLLTGAGSSARRRVRRGLYRYRVAKRT